MEKPFRDVVERSTDRKVLAYMSQVHANPDLAVELFVLEPQESPVLASGSQSYDSEGIQSQ
jgi:hypothetical protein